MKDSYFRFYRVSTDFNAPSTLVKAANAPIRVLVRNDPSSAVSVIFAHDTGAFGSAIAIGGPETFAISPADSEVFLLAPFQSLYALTTGAARIFLAVSEAFPIGTGK